MSNIEDRLRAAFDADAQTVRPETVHAFAAPALRGTRLVLPSGGTRSYRLFVPLASAAAVAVIALGTGLVVPRVWPGSTTAQMSAAVAQGFAGGQIPAGTRPKFLVDIGFGAGGTETKTTLRVLSTATGKVTGQLAAPAPRRAFVDVVPFGNDRTFLAEASGTRCDTWLYTFALTAAGRPTGLSPFVVPVVHSGRPEGMATSLAASANGRVIALATNRCTPVNVTKGNYGQVDVINLVTHQETAWPFHFPAAPVGMSLSADGSLLELVSNPSRSGAPGLTSEINAAWIVHTNSGSGPLVKHYRKVFGPPMAPLSAVLSPNGKRIWGLIPSRLARAPHNRVTLNAFATATGRPLRTLHAFPRIALLAEDAAVHADISGRFLLVSDLTVNGQTEWIDLATGELVPIPGAASAGLSVAW